MIGSTLSPEAARLARQERLAAQPTPWRIRAVALAGRDAPMLAIVPIIFGKTPNVVEAHFRVSRNGRVMAPAVLPTALRVEIAPEVASAVRSALAKAGRT